MITAILDTNVLVQSLISSASAASARVLDAYFDGQFRLIYSTPVLDEYLEVFTVPRMRARHELSDDEILDFLAALLVNGAAYDGKTAVSSRLIRDLTDTKFLSLAAESSADFLVMNDHRHLLPLKKYKKTKIVTPSRFLAALGKAGRE